MNPKIFFCWPKKDTRIQRVSYYTHVRQKELDLEILAKYAKALVYDFSEEIPEMKNYILQEPEPKYPAKPKTFEEALEMAEHWRTRYFEEVAKNNKLLELLNKINL